MYKKLMMWIRFFFGFSRTEANGFVVLALLMFVFLLLPLFTKQLFFASNNVPISNTEQLFLDSLVDKLDQAVIIEVKERSLSTFDINTISAEALTTYGLPLYLAKRIVKYRTQVKPFTEKSELLKIYGLDSSLYQQLYPYLTVVANNQVKSDKKRYSTKKKVDGGDEGQPRHTFYESKVAVPIKAFDLNEADTTQLKQIYGIGTAYAKRIVAFRELLGGFYSLKQLGEVYGLKPPTLDSLQAYTFIKPTTKLNTLPLNVLTVEELSKHPYISYKQAKLIIAYRMQHGNYLKAYDLLQIGVFDSLFVEKISPYLHFKE